MKAAASTPAATVAETTNLFETAALSGVGLGDGAGTSKSAGGELNGGELTGDGGGAEGAIGVGAGGELTGSGTVGIRAGGATGTGAGASSGDHWAIAEEDKKRAAIDMKMTAFEEAEVAIEGQDR